MNRTSAMLRRHNLVMSAILPLALSANTAFAADQFSLQEQIAAKPGQLIEVPPGTYHIKQALVLDKPGAGLIGYGTIVQDNPAEEIVHIENVSDIRVEGITLTRPEGKYETTRSALMAYKSSHLIFRNVTVRNNRTQGSTFRIQDCDNVRIDGCEVVNYKRLGVEDRTGDPKHGFAFNGIGGDGIGVRQSSDVAVRDCVVAEYEMLTTHEFAEKHRLGYLTEGKNQTKLGVFGNIVVKNNRCQVWHQGSAFEMTGAGKNKHFLLTGNKAINAAQGFDMHFDYGICSNNMIDHCVIGLKLTHGDRNVVVNSNVVSHADLWGILLNPGTLSHSAKDAGTTEPAVEENVDRGIILSNNMITDFGYGFDYWNWGSPESHLAPNAIAMFEGQEMDEPPLRDVVLTGNMVYNAGRDGVLRENKINYDKPRYEYAVYMGTWSREGVVRGQDPVDIHFSGNLFEAGSRGVCNVAGAVKDQFSQK